jgi:drug/metabolite transporter (DMT)-like permease
LSIVKESYRIIAENLNRCSRARPDRMPAMRPSGTVLCLASAAGFGAMAAFGKLAYDEGATVGTLLSVRFTLAAALFWVVTPAREVRALGRRDVAIAVGLGMGGYALQAGCYFAALDRIDASVLTLLVYTYPAMVAVAAFAIGRERMDVQRLAALALASGGLVLVLAGAGGGALDPLGAAVGLGAAVVYCAYILVGDGVAVRIRPQVLATIVCSGAAVTLTAGSAALGELRPGDLTLAGWGWLACLAVVSTVGAISLFFAGLKRVGPTMAAILSTAEPVVTVVLAFLLFGEGLGPMQLIGGLLVLAATPTARLSAVPDRPAEPTAPPRREGGRGERARSRRIPLRERLRSRPAGSAGAARPGSPLPPEPLPDPSRSST